MSNNKTKRIIAVCGKGGVGKTAFTAMAAKSLMGKKDTGELLLIDADPALGLSAAIGISIDKTIGRARETIINAARGSSGEEKSEVARKIDFMVMESLLEMDDFSFIAMGRSEAQGCFCLVNSILKESIKILSGSFDTILIDGEAGLEQINRQVMSHVDTLVILSDTSSRGRQTVEHIKKLISEEHIIDCDRMGVVFNRVNDERDLLSAAMDKIGIDIFGFIPQDKTISEFDLMGRPLTELPMDSPAMKAINDIVVNQLLR